MSTRAREGKALELRSQCKTYDQIAHELGFSNRGAAHKAVQRAFLATIRQPAEALRTLQIERLEEAFRALWPKATDPADPQHLRAVDTMLSVMDRMDRLTGLGARRSKPAADVMPSQTSGSVLVITPHTQPL